MIKMLSSVVLSKIVDKGGGGGGKKKKKISASTRDCLLPYEHELLLLSSIFFLTLATSATIYQTSMADTVHVALFITIWQSRYLLVRYLCVSRGWRWLSKCLMAGQYCDYNNVHVDDKQFMQSVNQSLLFDNNNSSYNSFNGSGGGGGGESHSNLQSLHNENDTSTFVHKFRVQYVQFKQSVNSAYKIIDTYVQLYVPPLQMCLAVSGALFALMTLFSQYRDPFRRSFLHQYMHDSRRPHHSPMPHHYSHPHLNPQNIPQDVLFMQGISEYYYDLSWKAFIFHLIAVGILPSLALYGRLILPFPDLLSNALKSGGYTSNRHHQGKVAQKYKRDQAWAENYKPVNAENRFKLTAHIILLRSIENLYLTTYLPCTEYVCQFTQQCQPGRVLWERMEITGKLGMRPDLYMYDYLKIDTFMVICIGLSIFSISLLLLFTQAVTLDGLFLKQILVHTNHSRDSDLVDYVGSGSTGGSNASKKKQSRKNSNSSDGRPPDGSIVSNACFWFIKRAYKRRNMDSRGGRTHIIATVAEMHFSMIILSMGISFMQYQMNRMVLPSCTIYMTHVLAGIGVATFGIQEKSKSIRTMKQLLIDMQYKERKKNESKMK